MNLLLLLISTLAVVRICILLQEDDGPFHVFDKLRRWAGLIPVEELEMPEQIKYSDQQYIHDGNFFAEVLNCIYCLSVWVALFVAIYLGIVGLIEFRMVPLYALCLSTLTILIKNRRIISG